MILLPRTALLAGALALITALAACTATPPPAQFPQVGIDAAPIRLDVGTVAIERAYQPPNAAPNVDHRFPVRPLDAAVQWAETRLVAAGVAVTTADEDPTVVARRARFIVRDASVVETSLEPIGGLKGLFTTEQSERYDARVVVEIEIVDGAGQVVGTASATGTRTRTVPEDITLSEREEVWFEMTEELMHELDTQLEHTIRSVFADYVAL